MILLRNQPFSHPAIKLFWCQPPPFQGPQNIPKPWKTSARKRLTDRTTPFLWDGFAEVSCHAYLDVEAPERQTDTKTIATYLARGYRTISTSLSRSFVMTFPHISLIYNNIL